ncbi:hypothetical protein Lal_00027410 [Lupinus albus]|nr:hypothetical protein Lal_00027410 [Lupinus albus]
MEKTIQNIRSNFNSIRTDKSNSAMLDKIEVEYYGSPVNLKSIAQISTPNANSILVQPYYKSSGDIITCNLWKLHVMKFINYYKKLRNGDSPPTVSRSWYGSRLLIGEEIDNINKFSTFRLCLDSLNECDHQLSQYSKLDPIPTAEFVDGYFSIYVINDECPTFQQPSISNGKKGNSDVNDFQQLKTVSA